jgi:hypothetical protein
MSPNRTTTCKAIHLSTGTSATDVDLFASFSPGFAGALAAADEVGRMYRLTADLQPEVHAATLSGVVATTVEQYQDAVWPLERDLTHTEVRMLGLYATAQVSARHAGPTDAAMRQQVFHQILPGYADRSLWSETMNVSSWFRAALSEAEWVNDFYVDLSNDFCGDEFDLDMLRQEVLHTTDMHLSPYRPLLTDDEWTDLLAVALTGSSTDVDWLVGGSIREQLDVHTFNDGLVSA